MDGQKLFNHINTKHKSNHKILLSLNWSQYLWYLLYYRFWYFEKSFDMHMVSVKTEKLWSQVLNQATARAAEIGEAVKQSARKI